MTANMASDKLSEAVAGGNAEINCYDLWFAVIEASSNEGYDKILTNNRVAHRESTWSATPTKSARIIIIK
jgi:hypothetical protein